MSGPSPTPSPGTSPRLSATLNIPHLPWNIIRRIIHFRLALTPSIPAYLDAEGPVTVEWDALAGRIGMKVRQKRIEDRRNVMAAVGLLRVCKAWKNIVLKYIYTEPHLTDSNFFSFARAILNGDKKWDDLRVHPHSIPGRYVSTLDLSSLTRLEDRDGGRSILRTLRNVLPVLPNITHLKLPAYQPSKDRIVALLADLPVVHTLRALEGLRLHVVDDATLSIATEREVYQLLKRCPRLEYLNLESCGAFLPGGEDTEYAHDLSLDLPRLHTLQIEAWTPGLIHILSRGELPRLQRLLTESIYNDREALDNQNVPATFKQAHGHKLVSLTILPMPGDSSAWDPYTTTTLLDDHPSLRHLSILSSPFELATDSQDVFAASLDRPNHPLSHITLHKWNHPEEYPPSPSHAGAAQVLQFQGEGSGFLFPRTSEIIETILLRPPPDLESITIDGNTWVSPKLGRAALSTGISAEMRSWSSKLRTHGFALRDMEGKEAPRADGEDQMMGRGRRMSRNNDQRMDRALWDPYRGATRRAQSRRQGDDQDGG